MKYSFQGKFVTVTAESVDDNVRIIALQLGDAAVKSAEVKEPVIRRRVHLKKACGICGKYFKGVRIHMKKAHTIDLNPII